jgi:hypothetical protein
MPPTSSGTIQLLRLLRKIVCELNGRGAAMASPNLSSTPRANRMDGLLAWSGSGRRPSQPQIPRTTSDKLPSPIPDGANALGQAGPPVLLPRERAGFAGRPRNRRPPNLRAPCPPASRRPEPLAHVASPRSPRRPPAGVRTRPSAPPPEPPPPPCCAPCRRPEWVAARCPDVSVRRRTYGPRLSADASCEPHDA